jgi:hypothetical protein
MQQPEECPTFGKCELLEYDDSKCKDVCKCCVGIHDFGDHAKCTSACRKCRNFGTTWDPRRPMKPLDYSTIYTDAPGYATTGEFVAEHFVSGEIFDWNCLFKTFAVSAALIYVAGRITKRKLNVQAILALSALAAFMKCMFPQLTN